MEKKLQCSSVLRVLPGFPRLYLACLNASLPFRRLYNKVYIVSDHENLYEKYGFHVIDRKIAPWGSEEKIYVQEF